ncbi:Metallo-hydrolase/oxidoreductase [Heliocybe sulcata]|uniref:Metallo-hydrolase/oxidoreductase n=1 Tax=Heliocybe sulcata TaxID=5364 RepID=A0A5C3MTW8_9AGAM|nr:Metallo-hydrolase/oxidoreductase [Heliocybe sulcata]
MFDLGVRKNPERFSPAVQEFLGPFSIRMETDAATMLKEGGVDPETVDAIIWRHTHYDHTGDPSTFPSTTEVVIGPGTKAAFFPPYQEGSNSTILTSDFEGRKVTELGPEDFHLTIGGLGACYYFGDGSFYLLDTPGHCPGHITALARVTPTTFILMGGDTCHHPGQLRPSPYIPCPCSLLANVSPEHFPHVASSTAQSIPLSTPVLTVPYTPPSAYTDPSTAASSIAKLSAFDADPDVLVLIAHDSTLEDVVSYFPEKADNWKEQMWKARRWSFLDKESKAWRFSVT